MAQAEWPEEDAEALKRMWALGWSGIQMSRGLGDKYSRNACIGKANRMKLPPRDNNINRGYEHRSNPTGTKAPKAKLPITALPMALGEAPLAIGPAQDFPEVGFCRWPVRDIPDFQCCGQANHPGRPYCLFHAMLARGSQPKPTSGAFRSDRIR